MRSVKAALIYVFMLSFALWLKFLFVKTNLLDYPGVETVSDINNLLNLPIENKYRNLYIGDSTCIASFQKNKEDLFFCNHGLHPLEALYVAGKLLEKFQFHNVILVFLPSHVLTKNNSISIIYPNLTQVFDVFKYKNIDKTEFLGVFFKSFFHWIERYGGAALNIKQVSFNNKKNWGSNSSFKLVNFCQNNDIVFEDTSKKTDFLNLVDSDCVLKSYSENLNFSNSLNKQAIIKIFELAQQHQLRIVSIIPPSSDWYDVNGQTQNFLEKTNLALLSLYNDYSDHVLNFKMWPNHLMSDLNHVNRKGTTFIAEKLKLVISE